jgi:hypothetical protein
MTAPSSRNGKTRRNAPFSAFVEAVATGRNDVFSHSSRGKCIAKDAEATREAREYAPPPTSALLNPHRDAAPACPMAAISFITAFRTPDAVHCPDAVMQASD